MKRRTVTKVAGLGDRLRRLRRIRGLSQSDVGAALGVHGSHISHLESGRSRMVVNDAIALADLLEVSLDRLLRGPA